MTRALNYLADKLRSLSFGRRDTLVCSDCFADRGLALEARKLGQISKRKCRHCNSEMGAKLDRATLDDVAENFFVRGSFVRTEFGGATVLRFGAWGQDSHREVRFPTWLDTDARLIENSLGIGFRYYGPPTWRLGEVEPLESLMHILA